MSTDEMSFFDHAHIAEPTECDTSMCENNKEKILPKTRNYARFTVNYRTLFFNHLIAIDKFRFFMLWKNSCAIPSNGYRIELLYVYNITLREAYRGKLEGMKKMRDSIFEHVKMSRYTFTVLYHFVCCVQTHIKQITN